jgi:hypothetical protein
VSSVERRRPSEQNVFELFSEHVSRTTGREGHHKGDRALWPLLRARFWRIEEGEASYAEGEEDAFGFPL